MATLEKQEYFSVSVLRSRGRAILKNLKIFRRARVGNYDAGFFALGSRYCGFGWLPYSWCVGFCTPIYLRAAEFAVWRSMMETWVLFKSAHARCKNHPGDTVEVKMHKGDVIISFISENNGTTNSIVLDKKVAFTFFDVCGEFMRQVNSR